MKIQYINATKDCKESIISVDEFIEIILGRYKKGLIEITKAYIEDKELNITELKKVLC